MKRFFSNMISKYIVLISSLLLFINSCLAQDNIDFYFAKTMRIENEIKISIPIDVFDDIYVYLLKNYTTENFFLHKMDSNFSVTFAEDLIIDQYYDNEDMQLITGKDGIRHRKREVLSNPEDKKHGRELMQIKIDSVGGNPLSRGEIKYDIKYYKNREAEYDSHKFLGLIKREDRYLAIRELKRLGIDPLSLFPTIRIEQNRKRVYISYKYAPLMTITLDSVMAYYERKEVVFIELELEINENLYTQSDSIRRIELESYSSMIFNDLQNNFPSIKQDQTPKYNKAFNQLNISKFTKPFKNFGVVLIGLFVVVIIISVLVYFLRKHKKT